MKTYAELYNKIEELFNDMSVLFEDKMNALIKEEGMEVMFSIADADKYNGNKLESVLTSEIVELARMAASIGTAMGKLDDMRRFDKKTV